MQPLGLLSMLLFLTLQTFGQSKNIVLQIDSLELNGYEGFSIQIVESSDSLKKTRDILYKKLDTYPNLSCLLTLRTETSHILISIDKGGGHLQLAGAYQLHQDTLKIDKVAIFDNCYCDNTVTRISYFVIQPDKSIGEPFKVKLLKKNTRHRGKNCLGPQAVYYINNKAYSGIPQKQENKEVVVANFHGYKPKKYLKDRDNYKGRAIYFHGSSFMVRFINVITLDVQKKR